MFPDIDWDNVYLELARVLPNDPRFAYDAFFNYTPLDQIFKTLDLVRKQRFEKLHYESIAISILTAQFTEANTSKGGSEISAEDFQPFKSFVDKVERPEYHKAAASTLLELNRVGLLPTWVFSLLEYSAVKAAACDLSRVPYLWSNREVCLIHPRVVGETLKARLAFYNWPTSKSQTLIRLHGNYDHDYRIPIATIKIDDSLCDCLETDAEFEIQAILEKTL